jgi:hypothetical protein
MTSIFAASFDERAVLLVRPSHHFEAALVPVTDDPILCVVGGRATPPGSRREVLGHTCPLIVLGAEPISRLSE